MSARPKQLVLMEAYLELTEKEGVCFREENIEAGLATQDKKGKLLEELTRLSQKSPLQGEEKQELDDGLRKAIALEEANAQALQAAMKENREAYKEIAKHSDSASKVRKVYGRLSQGNTTRRPSLTDQA